MHNTFHTVSHPSFSLNQNHEHPQAKSFPVQLEFTSRAESSPLCGQSQLELSCHGGDIGQSLIGGLLIGFFPLSLSEGEVLVVAGQPECAGQHLRHDGVVRHQGRQAGPLLVQTLNTGQNKFINTCMEHQILNTETRVSSSTHAWNTQPWTHRTECINICMEHQTLNTQTRMSSSTHAWNTKP